MRKLTYQPIEMALSKTFFYTKLNYEDDSIKYGLPEDDLDEIFNFKSIDFYKGFSQSELLTYFKELGADTPQALNAVVSYHRTAFKTRLLRFNNYLHRSGKRLKFLLLVLKALDAVTQTHKSVLYSSQSPHYNWRELLFISSFFVNKRHSIQMFDTPPTQHTSFSLVFQKLNLLTDTNLTPDNPVFKNLLKVDTLFSFYVYKVDKHLFKNSRGKSGKFTFVWKYVPAYKRFNLISHWFMRELRITPGKTLEIRLINLFTTFSTNPHNSWLWKVKKFSAIFVYSNLRNSLAQTYRVSRKSR